MKTTYKISCQTTFSRMVHSLIIYAILMGLLYAATTVPLANVVLQTNMNGNGQSITNLASVTATTFYGSISQAINAGYATNSGTAGYATNAGVATNVSGIVALANGGTGTSSPSLVGGANISVSGTWPNQTISAAISNSYASYATNSAYSTNSGYATNASYASYATNSGYATNSLNATNAGYASYAGNATNVLTIVPVSMGGTGTATTSQNYFFGGPTSGSGAPGFRAIIASDVPVLNQNTSGTAASLSAASALPNGTTATTQTAGDTSTKIATDQYVQAAVGTSGGPYMPVRQTVLSGPIDVVAGTPTYLPAISSSLSLTTQNIASSPGFLLVVTSANGFGSGGAINTVGTTNSTLTWSGLTANTTNYLYVTISAGALTPGSTTLAPIYELTGSPSTTNNQFTFNINQMIGYMGNGSTAPQASIVFIGEAVTNSTTVTSTVAYGYQGTYDSGYTSTLPGTSTTTTKNHNLGYADFLLTTFRVKCLTPEAGHSVGDVVYSVVTNNGGTSEAIFPNLSGRNSCSMNTGGSAAFQVISSGGFASLTAANWAYAMTVKRSW